MMRSFLYEYIYKAREWIFNDKIFSLQDVIQHKKFSTMRLFMFNKEIIEWGVYTGQCFPLHKNKEFYDIIISRQYINKGIFHNLCDLIL